MKSSKLLIAIALISVALLAVETFGQRELPMTVPGRFQICADEQAIYAIETDTGKLWRYTGDTGFQKISQIPDSE